MSVRSRSGDDDHATPTWLSRTDDGDWLVRVKAVPGASRDEIAGALGDRLKIRVAAPPEAGKANSAIRKLLARRLGVPPRDVALALGASTPEKTLHLPASVALERLTSLADR